MSQPRKASATGSGTHQQLLALLSAISAALARGGGRDEVLQASCQALVDNVGAAFARVWILEPGDEILPLRASAGIYTHLDGEHGAIRLGDLEIGHIAGSQEPVLTNDVPNEPRISDHEWARREGMVSFAGHPLLVNGRTEGVIGLFGRRPNSPALIQQLSPMADTLAQFVARERAVTALRQSEEATRRERAQAAQEESQLLALDLHNAVSQSVYGISISARAGLRANRENRSHNTVREAMQQAPEASEAALVELKALIFDLWPEALEQ